MNEATKKRPEAGQIYTTGAFCEPCKWTDPNTGKVQWCWVVTEFNDDSYKDGDYIDPAECADTKEELMKEVEID